MTIQTFTPSSIGTTAQRPSNAQTNWVHYNTDNNAREYFDGSSWIELDPTPLPANNARVANGTYTGDGTNNRSISIGAGLLLSVQIAADDTANIPMLGFIREAGRYLSAGAMSLRSTTTFDVVAETAFVVGASGSWNTNLQAYAWVAIQI